MCLLPFLWDFGDSNGSADENPQHTYSASDTYNVCLYLESICADNQVCQDVTVDILTGIDEANTTSMLVYLNQTDGQFTIKVNRIDGKASLNLFDMAGRIVYTEAVVLTRLLPPFYKCQLCYRHL
jgi:hypothetical protein